MRLGNAPRKLQSIIDTILKPLINKMPTLVVWIEAYVSKYFLMFIQGITLFQSDGADANNIGPNIGIPAYHRAASCGPNGAGDAYDRNNLDCTGIDLDIVELQRRRRNAWNCFIERRIYEEMYVYVRGILEQNFGHRYRMRHVEQNLFQTCFPLMHVNVGEVVITWTDFVPLSVKVTYYMRMPLDDQNVNGAFYAVSEIYTRTFLGPFYTANVSCQKQVISPDDYSTETMFKVQNFFAKTENWTMTQSGGGGRRIDKRCCQDPWIATSSFKMPIKPKIKYLLKA